MTCTGTYSHCSSGECTDCDDDNKDINPGKTEICNNLDDDCDNKTDRDGNIEEYEKSEYSYPVFDYIPD